MPTLEPWAVLADVADHLQVSDDTVLRWIASRNLPGHRMGRMWRFQLTEVDAWMRVLTSGRLDRGVSHDGHHACQRSSTVVPLGLQSFGSR